MNTIDEVRNSISIYGHELSISSESITVDGYSYKLKTYSGYTYKVQKTQVQCQTAESLYKFIVDPFWEVNAKAILNQLGARA